jgi:hypothetical protein
MGGACGTYSAYRVLVWVLEEKKHRGRWEKSVILYLQEIG